MVNYVELLLTPSVVASRTTNLWQVSSIKIVARHLWCHRFCRNPLIGVCLLNVRL